jgi:hypothetical protein
VSPIGEEGSVVRGHADWLLEEIITPVFSEHFKEFEIVRADRISSPGMIDSQVINHALDAELVIADLSFQNPNVFYEMGLRHREQKPIIHMFLVGQELPFDVKPYRAIPFSLQHPKHLAAAKDLLRKAIEAVLDPGYTVENPVTRARGYAELSKHAMPAQELILAEIESVKRDVRSAAKTAASAQAMAERALNSSRDLPTQSLFGGGGTLGNSGFGSSLNSGLFGSGFDSGIGSSIASSGGGTGIPRLDSGTVPWANSGGGITPGSGDLIRNAPPTNLGKDPKKDK